MRQSRVMHTHFGSATHLVATFLGVLLVGTFWRIGWLHLMRIGVVKNSRLLSGLGRAALAQY